MVAGWSVFSFLGITGLIASTKTPAAPAGIAVASLLLLIGIVMSLRATRMATIRFYREDVVVTTLWRTRRFARGSIQGFVTTSAVGGFGRRGQALVIDTASGPVRLSEWWSSDSLNDAASMTRVARELNAAVSPNRG